MMNKKKDPNVEKIAIICIDAINQFCRDVLIPKGYLLREDWLDKGLLPFKYEIAEKAARRFVDDSEC